MAGVSTVFSSLLSNLAEAATSVYEASTTFSTATRKWMNPPTDTGWSGDPHDIATIEKAFDREDMNVNYTKGLADASNPSGVGVQISLKFQIDYVAAMERAYRQRNICRVRSQLHSAARRKAQGESKGVFKSALVVYAGNLDKAGQA